MNEPHRATRDIDLLALDKQNLVSVRQAIAVICNIPCPEDGIDFNLESLRVSPIRDRQENGGLRVKVTALLDVIRIPLQLDLSFGDAVTSEPETVQMPTLIERVPEPVLLTYPKVATTAEKFEAMVQLGSRNSRMKDFHDIWALSEHLEFEGKGLQEAVLRCFERRGTRIARSSHFIVLYECETAESLDSL